MPPVLTNDPNDLIKHVVVLMLENRSFDHALGCLQGHSLAFETLDGIDPSQPLRSNPVRGGQPVLQQKGANSNLPQKFDLPHDTEFVLKQINNRNMDGFAQIATDQCPGFPDAAQQCMNYYAFGALPAMHALAESFAVCDHWHASVPGPTWANRFFAHSGTSMGKVLMPGSDGTNDSNLHNYNQQTIYDRLNQKQIPWKIYHGDFPQSLLLTRQHTEVSNLLRYAFMPSFYQDAAKDETAFPSYAFIEPQYFGQHPNDGHPPHNIQTSQTLIANVYNAIRANDRLFRSTLLIIVYDEHGGFYDHAKPPPASDSYRPVPVCMEDQGRIDDYDSNYQFDSLGVRVPALLISPYTKAGVCPTVFDHTSILRYLIEKWGLAPLTQRVNTMPSIRDAVQGPLRPDDDMPYFIDGADEDVPNPVEAPDPADINGGQDALVAFSEYLDGLSGSSVAVMEGRIKRLAAGSSSQAAVVVERLNAFVAKKINGA